MAVETGVVPTRSPAQLALMVGALGVVFGDIGTSPIYTVQTIFNPAVPCQGKWQCAKERVSELAVCRTTCQ